CSTSPWVPRHGRRETEMAFVVDPTTLRVEGATIDWLAVATRLGYNVPPNTPPLNIVELRWMQQPDAGLPTEPFAVWTTAYQPTKIALRQQLTISQLSLDLAAGYSLITWREGSVCDLLVDGTATSAGLVIAFAGSPIFANFCAAAAFPAGATQIAIAAPVIDGLLVSPEVTVSGATGLLPDRYANANVWTQVELVGRPVL